MAGWRGPTALPSEARFASGRSGSPFRRLIRRVAALGVAATVFAVGISAALAIQAVRSQSPIARAGVEVTPSAETTPIAEPTPVASAEPTQPAPAPPVVPPKEPTPPPVHEPTPSPEAVPTPTPEHSPTPSPGKH